ncbi:MAG: hypothetical protein E7266_03415 [Lachnospiraceae bacterium]|nr:hypothetical protein [Lachnospiraceae bacterium]
MKKIALLLVTCMTVATIAVACGGKDDKKETTTKKTTEKTTEATTEAPTEEVTTEGPTEAPTTAIVDGVTDNDDGSQTLGCSAWWAGTGIGKDYALSGDGSVVLNIKTTDNTRAFSVELYTNAAKGADAGYFMTTGSDGNGWFAETLTSDNNPAVANPFADNGNADPGKFVPGNEYKVTITRADKTYTMVYHDLTTGEDIYTMTGVANVDAPADLYVHVMAQVGNITVSQAE